MALTELTKVTGPGIHTLSNVLSHNIKSSGIITATKFSGPLDSVISKVTKICLRLFTFCPIICSTIGHKNSSGLFSIFQGLFK